VSDGCSKESCALMRAAVPALAISLAACACLYSSLAFAQEPAQNNPAPVLPGSPAPAFADTPVASQPTPPDTTSKPTLPSVSGMQPGTPLTLQDRFTLEVRTTFGPGAFATPVAEAATNMVFPPNHYPHEWADGAGAFGRNYGADLARHTAGGLTHFAAAAILHEDPRYYPSSSTNPAARLFHSLAFTLVDRSNSGGHTIAFSNLAGCAGAGFIGMAIYPDGFNDTTHAYQHAAVEITTFAAHNMIAEFSPEISRVLRKLHFPDRVADSFLPPDRKQP